VGTESPSSHRQSKIRIIYRCTLRKLNIYKLSREWMNTEANKMHHMAKSLKTSVMWQKLSMLTMWDFELAFRQYLVNTLQKNPIPADTWAALSSIADEANSKEAQFFRAHQSTVDDTDKNMLSVKLAAGARRWLERSWVSSWISPLRSCKLISLYSTDTMNTSELKSLSDVCLLDLVHKWETYTLHSHRQKLRRLNIRILR